MDCRGFRKQHLAYLDDTLPGDEMAAAQRHIMACDSCAAHDSMVRRSLMLVRNMSTIEPSVEFRQRMQARLNEARAESEREKALRDDFALTPRSRTVARQPVMLTAIAATALIAGTYVWEQRTPRVTDVISLKPVLVSKPAPIDTTQPQQIYIDPGMVRAMATGNPVWPAALMADDAPAQMMNAGFTEVKSTR